MLEHTRTVAEGAAAAVNWPLTDHGDHWPAPSSDAIKRRREARPKHRALEMHGVKKYNDDTVIQNPDTSFVCCNDIS